MSQINIDNIVFNQISVLCNLIDVYCYIIVAIVNTLLIIEEQEMLIRLLIECTQFAEINLIYLY